MKKLLVAIMLMIVFGTSAAMAQDATSPQIRPTVKAIIRVLDVVKGIKVYPCPGTCRVVVNEVIAEIVNIAPVCAKGTVQTQEEKDALQYLSQNSKQITLRVACSPDKNDDLAKATSGRPDTWKGILIYKAAIEVSKMEMPRCGNDTAPYSVVFVPFLTDYWLGWRN